MTRLEPGVNDLATTHPDLAAQWHPTKNGALTPAGVLAGTGKQIWWRCAHHHEFEASGYDRSRRGRGCPVCAGKRVVSGFNDLATTHPDLAAQWHPTKNGDLTPRMVLAGSERRVWWQCSAGHEWETMLQRRVSRGSGCAVCANMRVLAGFNDLATTHPDLATQWHPTKNAVSVTDLVAGTSKRVWWKCAQGHEWEVSPAERTRRHTGCPICANTIVVPGANDMATTHPDLAAQWHPTRNGELTPADIVAGTARRLWWQCSRGHEWATSGADRVYFETGCPRCVLGSAVSKREEQVATYLTEELGIVLERHSRLALEPGERRFRYDMVSEERRLIVEFNGLFWHQDSMRKPDDHAEKHQHALQHGYQLIVVWEDDWVLRPEVVKRMLAHKFGKSDQPRVPARACDLVPVTTAQARAFLTEHHIQGYASGSIRLGLRHPEHGVVAVMQLRVARTEAEIVRYATSAIVAGGFSKLLRSAEAALLREHPEVVRIKTFSDHAVSDGGLYRSLGFVEDGTIPPDYMYVVAGERVHKFNYRVDRFRKDPGLEYREGMTEVALAHLNNLARIWDAGKTRWVRTLGPEPTSGALDGRTA